MTDFFDQLGLTPDPVQDLFHPLDIVVVMAIVCACMLIVSRSYQTTHRGTSYAQSYIHSLFLMGICTGIVMMIIGSNIARAFSLVGALSIIRFRTAVKDVRDTAYLFFAVVIGMGAGTGFYVHTVVFTLAASLIMWVLYRSDYASRSRTEEVLKVTFRRDSEAPDGIESFLGETFEEHRLINSIRSFEKEEDTLVYVVRSRSPTDADALSSGLSAIDGVTQTALYVHDEQVAL
ncbi:MAG: DUF4956 domain-containing protein [Acidobacteriota bacterium]